MIMNTSTNRILEHLNIFSIDYYKQQQQQQQQQQCDEMKMNMTSNQHDKTLQTNIKDEKHDHHVENHLKSSLITTDNTDQPLLIVLDEDDVNGEEENEQGNLIINEIPSNDDLSNTEEQKNDIPNPTSPTIKKSLNKSNTSLTLRRPRKSRLFQSLNDRNHSTSNKFIRTVVIDTSFMHQTHHRQKLVTRRKNLHTQPSSHTMSTNSNTKTLSIDETPTILPSTDSILSNISFDNTSDILTVSRMGSIFYCLEDLYTKVFTPLCTLDEFTNLLSKPEIILIKQVTLSEKMSIDQQIPLLKKFNANRYRLLSINSSDYLLKLKQLLLTIEHFDENEKQQREKRLDQIIDEMRSYKRTSALVLFKDKVLPSPMATKRLSSDDEDDEDEEEHDDEPQERLKIVTKKQKPNETPPLAPTQFGIFIQCNGPVSCNIFSTNETSSSATTTTTNAETTTTTTTTVAKMESEITTKSTVIKKPNENTQIYFDKFQQNIPKSNVSNELSTNSKRTDSQSPIDCTHLHKVCSSNMPIKRRILNSYNSDTSDSSSTTPVPLSSSLSRNYSRCLHRSKSLNFPRQGKKNLSRRSSSLPAMIFHFKDNSSNKKSLSRDANSKLNIKSKPEPIDLTDGSYSMPMIVNVEENVEFNNQRQKTKNKKSAQHTPISHPEPRIPSTMMSRSTSHESDPSILTKSTPIHHPTPSPSYRSSPYLGYQQDSYTYRDSSQNNPQSSPISSHSYHPSTNPNNNGNIYPYPFSSSTQYPMMKKPKESSIVPPTHPSISTNNNPTTTHLSSAVVMPIVRRPNYYHQLTPEQQASIKMQTSPPTSTAQCRLPCCYPPSTIQQQSMERPVSNERTIYRQYAIPSPSPQTFKRDPPQTPDMQTSSPSNNRKQRRMDPIPPPSTTPYPPYPSTKSYFTPPPPPPSTSSSSHWPSTSLSPSNPNLKPPIRYPYPPQLNTPMNGMPRKIDPYPQPRRPTPVQSRALPPPSTPVVVQNSSTLISPPNTPHELTLPNIRTRSIDLQRAILERGYCDMDKLPKLVVRHTKTYSNRTIDTMGQLFPTWFNEPDYRCIHCFRCDQVFTPQQFMTHVDDESTQNEQPLSMTSIQLLTSEKMSEYKVGLWNQFCTNLTVYASTFSKWEKKKTTTNLVQGGSNWRFLHEQKRIKKPRMVENQLNMNEYE